jgi:hypothetical protein
MWDLVTVKSLLELFVEFSIKLTQPRSGAVVQHSLVPLGLWFELIPWQIIFATFRDPTSTDLVKMLTCGALANFMLTWNTIFEKHAYI